MTVCGECGGRIEEKNEPYRFDFHGHIAYTPAVNFYQCLECGERWLGLEACREIEAAQRKIEAREARQGMMVALAKAEKASE